MTDQPRSYAIRTYGCQMNEHDSERIAGLLEADGLVLAESDETADVMVFNTCCIRENAELNAALAFKGGGSSICKTLDLFQRDFRLWSHGVVGINIDRAHDSLTVDDDASRDRERPAWVAIDRRQINAEASIYLPQFHRQLEAEAKCRGVSVARITQDFEVQLVCLDHLQTVRWQLGR